MKIRGREDDANEIHKAQQSKSCKYDIFNVYFTLIYYGHWQYFRDLMHTKSWDASFRSIRCPVFCVYTTHLPIDLPML